MTGSHFLGLDIGAGSLKATLIDGAGRVCGEASMALVTHAPQPGWSEQDPDDWFAAVCATVPQALTQAGVGPEAIAALTFSAGAHSQVVVGADGRPLRRAIMWNDQRSLDQVRRLEAEHGREIRELGLNRVTATWTLPQLLWVAENEPAVRRNAARVYLAKDYLRGRISGDWLTDQVDALGTLMYDGMNRRWSDRLCGLIDWPLHTLPRVVEPHEIVGQVTAEAAAATGLRVGTPVVAGSSDTAIEAFGAGVASPGDALIKLATAGTVSVIGDAPRRAPGLIDYYFVVPGLWYAITGTNSCASAHRWLRDRFFMNGVAPDQGGAVFTAMDRMAAEMPLGADGLIFHPYLQGERSPHWDPLLRADFLGLTIRHQPGHLVRALYEGIAFSLRECLGSFTEQGIRVDAARIVGGGARSALWRQIIADVLGLTIMAPRHGDASYGAALLAAVGVGHFPSHRAAVDACVEVVERHDPDPTAHARYTELFGIYQDSQRRLASVCHDLHRFAHPGAAA